MRKDKFVDDYKQSDVIKDHINFLRKMEKLKFYMIEFNKNSIVKSKVYPSDFAVGREN